MVCEYNAAIKDSGPTRGMNGEEKQMRIRVDIVNHDCSDMITVSTTVRGSISTTIDRIVDSVGVNTHTHDVIVSVVS